MRHLPFWPSGGFQVGQPQLEDAHTETYSHKISIVESSAILREYKNCIVLSSALAEIVLLEVTAAFVKSVGVQQIMVHIDHVEQLGNRQVRVLDGLDVLPARLRWICAIGEVKDKTGTAIWAFVVFPVSAAIPIFVCNDL